MDVQYTIFSAAKHLIASFVTFDVIFDTAEILMYVRLYFL